MKLDFFHSKPFRFFSLFSNLLILNICWIALCLPLITAGASTAAMYHCVVQLHRDTLDHVLLSFWNAFRKNFKQATKLFLIQLAFLVITLLDVIVIMWLPDSGNRWLTAVLLMPFLLMLPGLLYFYPLQVSFENTPARTALNGWKLSLIHIPTSLALLILHLTPAVIVGFWPEHFMTVLMLWSALGGSLPSYLSMKLLSRVFTQYQI